VLRHRRRADASPPPAARAPDSRTGNDDATHRDTRERLPRDTAPSPDDAPASHGDWGYLPPESAGLRDVKAVVPLPLKKR